MKDKGQALVEFVLILPVILVILIALMGVGNLFIEKYKLNNTLDTVVNLYKNEKTNELKSLVAQEQISFNETKNGDLITISISKNLSDSSLKIILGDSYQIETNKTFYLETKEDKNE